MAEMSITCVGSVAVENTRDDGSVERINLEPSLVLKKEIGNARLVSGDTVLWVGSAALSVRDGDSGTTRVVRVGSSKRSFVFSLQEGAESKKFLAELKAQVEGQAGLAVRRKKRKIRKQLNQSSMGFVPVNTLTSPSPAKKPPSTPKRSPLAVLSSPRRSLTPALDVSVATVPDAYQTLTSPKATSKSPFRSPFRKKSTPPSESPALRTLKSPMPLNSLLPPSPAPSPARAREWLSPVQSLRQRASSIGSRSSDSKKSFNSDAHSRRDSNASDASTTRAASGSLRRSSVNGVLNKRVRSLQLMLDDDEPSSTASTGKTAAAGIRVSPFFLKKSPAKEAPSKQKPGIQPQSLDDEPMQSPTAQASSTSLSKNADDTAPHHEPAPLVAVAGGNHTNGVPVPSPHGLMNLGNFCYMNAIVQALASLPAFLASARDEDELLKLIRQQLGASPASRTPLPDIRASLETWKSTGDAKRLVLQYTLNHLLQQVADGSETPISPEPLKLVMGRRNAIFATHFQQDAHEFLLNLLNEYETELVDAVESCTAKIRQDSQPPQPAGASTAPPQRSSLLSFFRPSQRQSSSVEPKDGAKARAAEATARHELVGQLPPAKCFRAELFRTLTCRSCGYSRKQVETFYDFSLDLPFLQSSAGAVTASAVHDEPAPEPADSPAENAQRRCFCGEPASAIDKEAERVYRCPKSACSFVDKVPRDVDSESGDGPAVVTPPSSQQDVDSSRLAAGRSPNARVRPSLDLETLIRTQFQPETLELTCEKCKVGKEVELAYAVKSLPPVVALHLKRFEVDHTTGALYKRCDAVLAPAALDFVRGINNEDASASATSDTHQYMLKSVVHHLGRTIDEGHYVADICDASGRWVRRNDTHESLISEEYALSATRSQESCYMLFYVRAEGVGSRGGDKENLPANAMDDNSETTGGNTAAPDAGLRAFL